MFLSSHGTGRKHIQKFAIIKRSVVGFIDVYVVYNHRDMWYYKPHDRELLFKHSNRKKIIFCEPLKILPVKTKYKNEGQSRSVLKPFRFKAQKARRSV